MRLHTTATPEGFGHVFKHAIEGNSLAFNNEAWAVFATLFRPVFVKVGEFKLITELSHLLGMFYTIRN